MAIETALRWLLEGTLATAAALALVLALRRPVRMRFGAGAAYLLWWLVPVSWAAVSLPGRLVEAGAVADAGEALRSALPMLPAGAAAQGPVSVAAVQAGAWPGAILAVWLIGLSACVGLALWRQFRFVRGLGRLRRRADGLLQSPACLGLPAVVGLRARIILPADFERRYSPHQRALLLAHEHIHAARGDMLANAACLLVCAVFWFNPLLWPAVRAFRQDQELSCDARVLDRHPDARRSYGEAMLKAQIAGPAVPVASHWFWNHPLKERIDMLKRPSPSPRRKIIGAVLVLALLPVVGVGVWAAQPATPVEPAHEAGHAPQSVHAASGAGALPGTAQGALGPAHPGDIVVVHRPSASGAGHVDMQVVDGRAGDVLRTLAAESGVRLSDLELAQADRRLSFAFENVPLEDALLLIGDELGLQIAIEGDAIRLTRPEDGAVPAPEEIGRVEVELELDAAGHPRSVRPASGAVRDFSQARIANMLNGWRFHRPDGSTAAAGSRIRYTMVFVQPPPSQGGGRDWINVSPDVGENWAVHATCDVLWSPRQLRDGDAGNAYYCGKAFPGLG